MLKKYSLGKTSYGGKVFALEADEHFEIPALRCVASSGKIKKREASIEEARGYFNKNPSEAKSLVARVYDQKHSIGEMSREGIYLQGVSRLLTFLGWIPLGAPRGLQGVGTEKSLRRVKVNDYVDIGNSSLQKVCEKSFDTYKQLTDAGYPLEDSRYVLPLAAKTEEIIQIPLGRELGKWSNYLKSLYFTEAVEVGKILADWNYEKTGIKVKELPARENFMPLKSRDKIPERRYFEEMLEGVHYFPLSDSVLMNVSGSIASFHQEVRGRQERFLWPSWEEVVNSSIFVRPSSLKPRTESIGEVYRMAQDVGKKLWSDGLIESSIYAQPLGKEINIISSIHGWSNIAYTFMLRTCEMAEWEIRKRFSEAADMIKEKYHRKLGPMCEMLKECYEPRREECPKFSSLKKDDLFLFK